MKKGDYVQVAYWYMEQPVCGRVVSTVKGRDTFAVQGSFGLAPTTKANVKRVYKNRWRAK